MTMNRLLKIENRVSIGGTATKKGIRLDAHLINRLPSKNTVETGSLSYAKYLPIVGILKRVSTRIAVPLVPITLMGVFVGRKRLQLDELIFERKTDGKGHFNLLIRYNSSQENELSKAVIHIQVAGQTRLFKIPIINYEKGRFEIERILGDEKKKQLFNRLGLASESKLLIDKKLTLTSIAELTIN